ncbi:MAG: hypothetical protein WBA46_06650 [Thermomicrobiales bacterium]
MTQAERIDRQRFRRFGRAFLVGAIALAALTACGGSGKDAAPTPTATMPPPTATIMATPAPRITLGAIVFAADVDAATGGPAAPATILGRSTPTIHVFAETSALPAGTTIRIDWSINNVAVPNLMQEVTLNGERPAGWIEFHLTQKGTQSWPSGALSATITIDGSTTASGVVQLSGF